MSRDAALLAALRAATISDARLWLDNGRDFGRCCSAVANRSGAVACRTVSEWAQALNGLRASDADYATVEAAHAAARVAPENWDQVRAAHRTPEQARLAAEADAA